MVKIEVHKKPEKEPIKFPKLMVGKITGIIYLATSTQFNMDEWLVNTIALTTQPSGNPIGHKATYPAKNLEDFDGSITLRNEE